MDGEDILLRLEFACTKQEVDEAESISRRAAAGMERSRFGSLLAVLALLCAACYFFFVHLPRSERPIWIGVFIVIWIAVFFWLRASHRKKLASLAHVVVEIRDRGISYVAGGATIDLSWSCFRESG